jgi:NADH-quinone oxidoreductase subunit A
MPENYFARYLPFLIHVLIAFGLAGAIVVLSQLIGRHHYTRAKFQPYECGMPPIGDARERFSVKFYMVAMLFILFDVEAVFLYPWAILLRELKMFGFWEMLVYISIILVGLWYIWKKGVLDWAEKPGKAAPGTYTSEEFLRAVSTRPRTNVAELDEVGTAARSKT